LVNTAAGPNADYARPRMGLAGRSSVVMGTGLSTLDDRLLHG
jgi:hypothetical protein